MDTQRPSPVIESTLDGEQSTTEPDWPAQADAQGGSSYYPLPGEDEPAQMPYPALEAYSPPPRPTGQLSPRSRFAFLLSNSLRRDKSLHAQPDSDEGPQQRYSEVASYQRPAQPAASEPQSRLLTLCGLVGLGAVALTTAVLLLIAQPWGDSGLHSATQPSTATPDGAVQAADVVKNFYGNLSVHHYISAFSVLATNNNVASSTAELGQLWEDWESDAGGRLQSTVVPGATISSADPDSAQALATLTFAGGRTEQHSVSLIRRGNTWLISSISAGDGN